MVFNVSISRLRVKEPVPLNVAYLLIGITHEYTSSLLKEFINRSSESLSVETRRLIDPDRPECIDKIVKTALALINHGGG
jgi:hypothetical protein